MVLNPNRAELERAALVFVVAPQVASLPEEVLGRGVPSDIPLCVGDDEKQAGELLELLEDAAQGVACGETAEQFAVSVGSARGVSG
jgi:hypothetical protein